MEPLKKINFTLFQNETQGVPSLAIDVINKDIQKLICDTEQFGKKYHFWKSLKMKQKTCNLHTSVPSAAVNVCYTNKCCSNVLIFSKKP